MEDLSVDSPFGAAFVAESCAAVMPLSHCVTEKSAASKVALFQGMLPRSMRDVMGWACTLLTAYSRESRSSPLSNHVAHGDRATAASALLYLYIWRSCGKILVLDALKLHAALVCCCNAHNGTKLCVSS